MSLERIVTKEQETYPDLCEKNANGAKDDLCWRDWRGLLCKSRGFDGCVQFLDGTLLPLELLGPGFHGRGLRWLRENREKRRL